MAPLAKKVPDPWPTENLELLIVIGVVCTTNESKGSFSMLTSYSIMNVIHELSVGTH